METHYLVTKSNYFIKNSAFDLSLEEQRVILILASMVQPEDTDFKNYTMKVSDFIEVLGIKTENKYSKLPKITKELMQKILEINDEETGEFLQVAWLSAVKYKKKSGEVELEFSPHLKPYLLDLKGFYTQYRLSNILSMKSKYSPRFYELLKMNEYQKKGCIISIQELRKLFKAETIYPLYADFKKYIILQAQKELEQFSDIRFEFEEIKKVRKVDSIKFFIFENIPKDPKNDIKIPKIKTKTKKEISTEKFIKNQEKDIEKNQKVHQEFEELYKNFLELPEEKRIEIEKETYEDFLKESNSIDNKTLRGIFEKSKKSLIIKKIKN
jgi:plasmid replication initiation protein